MCGVAFVWKKKATRTEETDEIEEKLRPRGPDQYGYIQIEVEFGLLEFHASVLHVRGNQITPQPIQNACGDILCWNGEIFGGTEMALETSVNDTQWLSDAIERVSEHSDPELSILDVLQSIQGPFAVLFYHQRTQKLYFGHDRFGRRSLVCHTRNLHLFNTLAPSQMSLSDHIAQNDVYTQIQSEQTLFCLSSVTLDLSRQQEHPIDTPFHEVPCTGMFCLNLKANRIDHFPFPNHIMERIKLNNIEPPYITEIQDQYNCFASIQYPTTNTLHRCALSLLHALCNAVGVRVRTIPPPISSKVRVAILFSGGLDSVVLAALTQYHVPDFEPIELLNVCFDPIGFQSPDRLAARIATQELRTLFPTREWRLIEINILYEEVLDHQQRIHRLMKPCDTHMDFNIGAALYFLARGIGQWNALNEVEPALGAHSPTSTRSESTRSVCLFPDYKSDSVKCPVTGCGRKWKTGCLFTVCRVCCFRIQKSLRLCSPDDVKFATKEKFAEMGICERDIQALMSTYTSSEGDGLHCRVHPTSSSTTSHPKKEEKAAQERISKSIKPSYTSSARVVLVGIGADEQLAGYGRHKTAFLNGGHEALARELAMDMGRIWKRNLGRDDRCISANGKEARFPYLDENVVCLLSQIPTELLTDFSNTTERGCGDKYLLRVVARDFLGLNHCTNLSKRAIQFGTRIAKCSNAIAFQSNRKASGTALFHLKETGSTA
uniref:Asparagine synthetase domaincontaining protein putat n=1 Tax=Albugo laibachii Nc14 TaxID=890382 RepID=F0W7Q3_9STRA|nr:asparagine synthetase domaincontaining protein putat [Albugo laibachii Nc14]|eukprot:CCA17154.1 asparagine synthetase domaincontaining protein putat [Albugo laibachii Nc14]